MARRLRSALFLAAGATIVVLLATTGPTPVLEGVVPGPNAVLPAVDAAFTEESYRPGDRARLVIFNAARDIRLQIFRCGPERTVARSSATMNGVPVSGKLAVGSSGGRKTIVVKVGRWPSGLYFARLRAGDGRVGFAPFVVRPRRLGRHGVAVVLPTLTWQAYNFRDEAGDGVADSWYADPERTTVRLGRPHLSRGVPYGFRYHLGFLAWLHRTHKDVDVLSQSDLEGAASSDALARAYELLVFAGHHEYVTTREYDLVEGYRDRGGNLMFLSANNFFWHVDRRGDVLVRTRRWRDLGRPEAALVGVQYVGWGRDPRRPWIVRRAPAASWMFRGTGLGTGSSLARGGVEIDRLAGSSPRAIQVVAEIPDVLGPGMTAQMTYYRTPRGAKVFAAGAFHIARSAHLDPVVARVLENLWARLASD
jgi:hypothetical protein